KEREFLRIAGADLPQPRLEHAERLVPRDALEFTGAALGPGFPAQRVHQARGRVLLHDARSALGADHALVDRVVRVAVDVAHLLAPGLAFEMHADAAAAGAHVAGGGLDA